MQSGTRNRDTRNPLFIPSSRSPENLFKSFEAKSVVIEPTLKARLNT